MNKLKNLMNRFFILSLCIGLVISYSSCALEDKDKNLLVDETYLEKHDGTKWKAIEDDMRIYLRLNDDMDKALELWMSDLEFEKLLTSKECFYYSHEMLNTEEVKVLENSESKLAFTYLENETWTFSMDGERLKLEFKTLDHVREAVYFSKTTDNVAELSICPEEKSKGVFDWKFLK